MRYLLSLVLAVAALALVACGDDDDSEPATTTAAESTEAPEAAEDEVTKPDREGDAGSDAGGDEPERPGTELLAADSQYGSILFDSKQRAIYLFDKESSSESQCYGECAAAWPPVLTEGEPQAGNGVDAKLLGTTERDDGTTQLTYAGQPLYYYVDDPAGEVLCQNVEEFGGLWLVVQPTGEAVT